MRRHLVVIGAVALAVVSGLLLPSQSKAATQTVHFIVTGAGPGGGPQVRVFHHDGAPTPFGWYAYPQGFAGGVHVATQDLDLDGIEFKIKIIGKF